MHRTKTGRNIFYCGNCISIIRPSLLLLSIFFVTLKLYSCVCSFRNRLHRKRKFCIYYRLVLLLLKLHIHWKLSWKLSMIPIGSSRVWTWRFFSVLGSPFLMTHFVIPQTFQHWKIHSMFSNKILWLKLRYEVWPVPQLTITLGLHCLCNVLSH